MINEQQKRAILEPEVVFNPVPSFEQRLEAVEESEGGATQTVVDLTALKALTGVGRESGSNVIVNSVDDGKGGFMPMEALYVPEVDLGDLQTQDYLEPYIIVPNDIWATTKIGAWFSLAYGISANEESDYPSADFLTVGILLTASFDSGSAMTGSTYLESATGRLWRYSDEWVSDSTGSYDLISVTPQQGTGGRKRIYVWNGTSSVDVVDHLLPDSGSYGQVLHMGSQGPVWSASYVPPGNVLLSDLATFGIEDTLSPTGSLVYLGDADNNTPDMILYTQDQDVSNFGSEEQNDLFFVGNGAPASGSQVYYRHSGSLRQLVQAGIPLDIMVRTYYGRAVPVFYSVGAPGADDFALYYSSDSGSLQSNCGDASASFESSDEFAFAYATN